jgi:hypothetical protein
VDRFDAWDLSDDRVRTRVNDVDSVAGGIALEDADLSH